MDLEIAIKQISRTLVDAFDVDIQLWMGKAFVKLRETSAGASFADWAQRNPMAFESLLRVTSAVVRRLPQDSDLVIETIYTQLSRLPVEVKRAIDGGSPQFVNRVDEQGDRFFERYEEALKDLSDDELTTVVRLKPHQLREWVGSPSRIRPHLLKKWAEEEAEKNEKRHHTRAVLRKSVISIPAKVDAAAENAAPTIGNLADWLEAHGGKPPKRNR